MASGQTEGRGRIRSGAGWSGSVPPAAPVLRPAAGFQTGRARAQCAPGAHAIRLGAARPARHGAVPGRGATWYAGMAVYGLPLRPGPVPEPPVVRPGLVPRRTAPPKGSVPRGKAARRVRSNNHTTTTGLGPLRILLGVLLLLSLPCSLTFSPDSPLPPSPCPRPPPPFPGPQLATARSTRPSRRHRKPPPPDRQPAMARSRCSSRRHQKLGRSRWRPACANPATTESHPPCLRKKKKRGGEEVGGGRQGRLKHEYHTPSRRAPDPWRPPALHRRWVVGRPRS